MSFVGNLFKPSTVDVFGFSVNRQAFETALPYVNNCGPAVLAMLCNYNRFFQPSERTHTLLSCVKVAFDTVAFHKIFSSTLNHIKENTSFTTGDFIVNGGLLTVSIGAEFYLRKKEAS